MEEWTSFLEHPLDKDLYVPRKRHKKKTSPLRVLVTDAGSKIAYNIIYNISKGYVFGPDQEIILHLISSRGSINHKAVVLELMECGFPCFNDYVVSSNPAVAFKKVDIVIAVTSYEELPGRIITGALLYQLTKARQIDYANKDCKIIFAGPSTKAITVLLGAFTKFGTNIPTENISSATCLDTVICKAMLAAKLKTTTDNIKNVVIWGATYPDVRNATVRMYPPHDQGSWEKEDVPVTEALQDDLWICGTFAMGIYRRVMIPDLLKFGKAVAQSTIHHLKVLINGSVGLDEIHSMGVIVPPNNPYNLPTGIGFSFPVTTKEGYWEILKDIPFAVSTYLNMMRTTYNMTHEIMHNSMFKVVSFMLDYEAAQKQMFRFYPKYVTDDIIETRTWITKYFLTPNLAEGVNRVHRDTGRSPRKSIVWDDELPLIGRRADIMKSTIRFSTETYKDSKKDSTFSYGNEQVLSVFDKKSFSSEIERQPDLSFNIKSALPSK